MKRGILLAALGMTVAGVASANVFTSISPTVASQPQPPQNVTPANPMSPPELPAKPVVKAKAPVMQSVSVETRKAPVPLQVKSRPPVNLPAVEAKPTEAKPSESKPGEPGNPEVAAGNDAFNEKAAKAAIEADGYKGVTVLRKGVNGVWHASALRGKTTVTLTVDAGGAVTTE
jgi:hypothetical protein